MTDDHLELRASDADRERVTERLRDALAEGRLDMDEFNTRLDSAYKARTYGELVPLTRDLPAVGGAAPGAFTGAGEVAGSGTGWASRIGGPATSKGAFAFWSGFARRGRWTVPRVFTAFAMWGGGEIDLREARFEDREVVIRCFTVMGGMGVIAPPDLNVRVSGFGIMGGFGDDGAGEGTPDAPHVTVTGFALMGGVGVERKLRRADKQRLKEERRRERLAEGEDRNDRKRLG
ncbi:DUF1707 SHOCT-like domain-containing protein [Streptomyces tsukubensis]|uniref:DUF1707 domain-containing protein n=1 Tax=Streptomyces tsukubensis TaxID=83656 RepID=A0A1V4A670_9ACTN|nr:DUF1707 domain-containing protein [Streptomyces tsukubensis]OON76952.1 hypothetical protein B1H18_19500 [Streptomyces tsukubensis]QFR93820.1 DUF1707 domain-containing protein [Streptomyces tsukubensis]